MVSLPSDFFSVPDCGKDNGDTSFRFLGVFRETQEHVAPTADRFPTAEEAVGDLGTSIVLGEDVSVPSDRNRDGDLDGGFIGLESTLEQSVHVQSMKVEIFIPGAKLSNPVVIETVPLLVSLPPARVSVKIFSQTVFIRPDVLAFLAASPDLLPPLPFDMTVVMTVAAIIDGGGSLSTNEISYPVTVRATAP